MDEKNPFAGIKTYDNYSHLWLLTGFILLLQVAVYVVVSLLGDRAGLKFSPYESIMPSLLVTGYVSWAMLDGVGVSWRGTLADWNGKLPCDLKKAFKYFAGALLVLLGIAAVLLAVYWFWGPGLEKAMKPLGDHNAADNGMLNKIAAVSRLRLLTVLFSACVVAPVVEEVFFRRIVYTTLRVKKSFWFSAFWSGLLFAAFHGVAAVIIFPEALYLCWIYEREQRLPVNILVHALMNLMMVTLKVFI
jgi:membrane protease YdiL (CAAX protease family)